MLTGPHTFFHVYLFTLASWYSLPTPTPTPDNSDHPITEDQASEPEMIQVEEEEEESGTLEENPISEMQHLEAAVILLAGPTLKKFNDKGEKLGGYSCSLSLIYHHRKYVIDKKCPI